MDPQKYIHTSVKDALKLEPGTALWGAYHAAWTEAVGKPEYDKAVWMGPVFDALKRVELYTEIGFDVTVYRDTLGTLRIFRCFEDMDGHYNFSPGTDVAVGDYFFGDAEKHTIANVSVYPGSVKVYTHVQPCAQDDEDDDGT